MKTKRLAAVASCLLVLVAALASCGGRVEEPQTQARSYYEFFDTVSVILSYAGDSEAEFSANSEAVATMLKEYHIIYSVHLVRCICKYRLSKFNCSCDISECI